MTRLFPKVSNEREVMTKLFAFWLSVVDFDLVLVVLIPLFLAIIQVALVLHVRNTF